jgi:4'-phosphopantetheinyl transferase
MQLLWPLARTPPELAANEAHVWAVPLAAGIAAWDALWSTLAADERVRADKFGFDGPRRRFVVARGALRLLLAEYLGVRPEDVAFDVDGGGKPRLATRRAASDLRFNVSHSGDLALIAVAVGCEIGVDVEQLREVSNLQRIAQRYFHPGEVDDVLGTAPEERPAAFLRCWTAKEAVLKACGTGIAGKLDTFRVPLAESFEGWIDFPGGRNTDQPSRCWLSWLVPCSGYMAAVALIGNCRRIHCHALPI